MNPFRYTEPVGAEDLIDRDAEAAEIVDHAWESNNCVLVGPRRYGKTSLLRRVLGDASREGWAGVYVDFFGVISLADIAERIERAYAALPGDVATWFAGARRMLTPTARLGGGPVPASIEVSLTRQAEQPLLDRLALPRRLFERRGVRSLVVLDEFQDVLAATGNADAIIRSEIQHHGQAASYVFAGSHVGMMTALFGDRRRAFYGQAARVTLGPLRPDDVAEYVATRFAETGRDPGPALGALLDLAAGHPQRTMLLAHLLWAETAPGVAADEATWVRVLDRVRLALGDEHRAIWTSLPPGQRRVLVAVALDEESITASTRRHGGSVGGAVRHAIDALIARGELVADSRRTTGYRVVDPLLAAWVAEGRPEPGITG